MTRLLVFDLDGTLIDSRRDLADATNALLVQLGGMPLPVEAVASMVGEGAARLVARALDAAGLDPHTPNALGRFLALYDERLLVHTRPYDGIQETLDALRTSFQLAVLTNKPTRATMAILEGLSLLPFFVHIMGGDTPHGRKPDPAGLLQLVHLAGATPESTILVGDSPVDRETAHRAGTRICLVRYGFGFTFTEDDVRGEAVVSAPLDLLGQLLTERSP